MKTSEQALTAFALICFGLSPFGCRKSTPVSVVDIRSSGVELREVASTAEWPGFRGTTGDGHVADSAVPLQWSESENVKWTADVPGRGHGSPIVVGDLVLLPSAIDDQQQQIALAFDRATGQEVWRTVIHQGGLPSGRENHQKGTNANSTMASDGERLYLAFFNSGKIFASALDLQGNLLWQEELGSFASKFGFAPSPILYKSFVIVAADNFGGGYIAALDGTSGELAWRIARPSMNSHSTPAIVHLDGRDQMVISGCDKVASYDPASGEEIWSTRCTSETTCGTMISAGGKVYASGGFPDKQTVCLDGSGTILWENRVKIYEPSLLAVGDSIFAVSDDGIAYCWAAETGKERWKKRLGNNFSSSCWESGGKIFASDLAGNTCVFAANPEKYEPLAVNQLGNDCYATPAVVDGQIFTRVGYSSSGNRQEKLCCISQ